MTNPLIKYLRDNYFLSTILFIALGFFLLKIRDILIVIFVSYIIMASLSPFVDFLRERRIPNLIAALVSYLMVVLILTAIVFPLIPFFSQQIQSLALNFPIYLDRAASLFGINVDAEQLKSVISAEFDLIGKNLFVVTSRFFGGLFSLLAVFVISFYLLLDKKRIKNGIASLFPDLSQEKILTTFDLVEDKLGSWLRGQVLLSVIVGLLTWVALTLAGMDFALPLALLAGILEIVPTIGPIIAAIPAIIVALTISPSLAMFVIIVFIVIQVLENNILVPNIMHKAVGLNPIIIIIAVMIGAELIGVIGALLSIPFLSMLIIIIKNLKNS